MNNDRNLAVVISGSVEGLCAVAAVAPLFKEGFILERDLSVDKRTGIPHITQPHVLIEEVREATDVLFPDFFAYLLESGSIVLNFTGGFWLFLNDLQVKQHAGALLARFQSRPEIDATIIRSLSLSFNSIKFIWNTTILHYTTGIVKTKICSIEADLIVDAS